MTSEPDWLRKMSPRERATYENAHLRTQNDYLQILVERPDASFSEYDNIDLLVQMNRDGLITFRDGSKHTSMVTHIMCDITEAGRLGALVQEPSETEGVFVLAHHVNLVREDAGKRARQALQDSKT